MTKRKETLFGVILLTLVFLGFTVFFLFQTFSDSTASAPPPRIQPQWYTVETARGELLQNKSMVGNCHICHAYWVPIPRSNQTSNPRFAHANIILNHGSNDRCYNCHQIDDRNKYVANDNSDIIPETPEKLCERCHGLIYQDWLAGTHGKWTGRWDSSQWNEKKTYTCTECHDPHNPVFKYDIAAPPPVWPDKYIRSEPFDEHSGTLSGLRLDSEPEEIF